MIDINNKLEVFIITNGRGTFPYCKKTVDEQQGVLFKTTVIKGLSWLESNNAILDQCESHFFCRVDDDMLLNPMAVAYMWDCIKKQYKNIIMTQWRLWEPYGKRDLRGVKVYTHPSTKQLGFRTNHLGKIDKPFREDIVGSKWQIGAYEDILGIHACSTYEEHLKYAILRGEHNGKDFPKKRREMQRRIEGFNKSVKDQYMMSKGALLKRNRKQGWDFYQFCKNREEAS